MYLRFSWPCLIGVGKEDCGGGLGDVGKIRRTDKLLKYGAEVVDVRRINMEGGRVSNVVKTTIGKEEGRRDSGVDVWRCEFRGN